jgi:hypothetical protein
MWIMVEPVAEILFGIRWSPMQCYGCNTPPTLWVPLAAASLHSQNPCSTAWPSHRPCRHSLAAPLYAGNFIVVAPMSS